MGLDVVNHLAHGIGPRPAGTDAEREAGDYVAALFRELGHEVSRQSFSYIGWRPLAEPQLEVFEPTQTALAPALMPWTSSTPPRGVVGRLESAGTAYVVPGVYEWPKFEIVSDSGEVLGKLVAYPDGPAIPFPSEAPLFPVPGAMVGRSELQQFRSWLAAGERVRVRLVNACEYVPDVESTNVIATLPGESRSEVIVCAHHDTAFGSPGAEDNASGVEALVRVSEALAGRRLSSTVRCISFAGEELLTFGSQYYVRRLRERGELSQVKLVINLDMVGAGEFVWVFYGPETLGQARVRAAHLGPLVHAAVEASGLAERFDVAYDTPAGPSSDHWPFYESGVPCIFFLLWPYPAYHLPDDLPVHVSERTLDQVVAAVVHIIANWRQ